MSPRPPVEGLEQPCGTCGRVSGDHTLREWAACLGELTTSVPYGAVPDDIADAAAAAIRARFAIGDGVLVADHVTVRAATLEGAAGPVQVKLPALLLDFAIGVAGHPPVTVAELCYLADPTGMRDLGRLLSDSATGAADAAERTGA